MGCCASEGSLQVGDPFKKSTIQKQKGRKFKKSKTKSEDNSVLSRVSEIKMVRSNTMRKCKAANQIVTEDSHRSAVGCIIRHYDIVNC